MKINNFTKPLPGVLFIQLKYTNSDQPFLKLHTNKQTKIADLTFFIGDWSSSATHLNTIRPNSPASNGWTTRLLNVFDIKLLFFSSECNETW